MKLTLVTCTFNSGKTLARCLESVASQTAIEHIEHIIVDGGSRDDTLAVVSRFPHVAKVISERDYGVFDAFNKGLAAATGDYIQYLGSDDKLSDADATAYALAILKEEQLEYLSCPTLTVDEASRSQWQTTCTALSKGDKHFIHPSHPGFYMRTEQVRRMGGFPRSFDIVADTFVMLKAILELHGRFDDRIVAHFYQGGLSSTIENQLKVKKECECVYKLLGINEERKTDEQLAAEYRSTVYALRELFLDQLTDKTLTATLSADKTIAVFGTGVMAAIMTEALAKQGINVDCYVTTSGSDEPFRGKAIKAISALEGVDVVINTIEGGHYVDINAALLQAWPTLSILHWHEILDKHS
ncbi:glycosyltransferase [Pokkaliibacter sp. CJK22405]|uniref:glycosyltransferase n=1 Tax=Pokkaliibacter sp. CJK22405 TaxID=3384615 RepID=UPI0039850504